MRMDTDHASGDTRHQPERPASPHAARRLLRIIALLALPLAAGGTAWWMTRTPAPAEAPTATAAHDHAAMAGGVRSGDSAMPVTLTVDQARRIGVTFAPVTAEPMSREIRTVGQVAVDETRRQAVTLKVDGWVEELFVDFTGRAVRRGEPLLRLYSPMLVTAQEELLLARRLAAEVGDRSPDARADAEELVAAARRRLEYWDVSADQIATIERTGQVQRTITLYATASGVVIEKNVSAGQRIMAGEPILRVADLGTVWIEGEVYEQDLRAVRAGQQAVAEFDAYPGETWAGRVAYVYPMLSPDTRTARVRVALTNAGLRLKPGMYATLRIAGATRSGAADVLTVPRGAVLTTGERVLVFVRLADGRLEPRQVTVGASSHDRVEILRGVARGDTVVASATFLVDAESNLGTAMGGMGDMPGMEITLPPKAGAARPTRPPTPDREH